MHINRLADGARKIIPKIIFNLLRKAVNAVLAPVCFSVVTGHLRSALKSCAVDRKGNQLPWFSYPAIQFLLSSDFTGRRALEWGAGQSTFFWAKRVAEVYSFEHNRTWFEILRAKQPDNAKIFLIQENMSDFNPKLIPGKVDVIIVDGLDRYKSAQLSLGLISEDGVIIVDNSDGNHGEVNAVSGIDFPSAGDPTARYGINNLYADHGFKRIDFYGFAPCVSTQQCTSFFFKGKCFLLERKDVPVIRTFDLK